MNDVTATALLDATYLDLPDRGGRIAFSPAGSLWHIRHAGLIDGDTELTVYGHKDEDDLAWGEVGQWHLTGTCPTPRRSKRITRTVDEILTITNGPTRYFLCGHCRANAHLILGIGSRPDDEVLTWLACTDATPHHPSKLRALLPALHHRPDLTDVHDGLAYRVHARHVLRTAQVAAAPTTRGYRIGGTHELAYTVHRARDFDTFDAGLEEIGVPSATRPELIEQWAVAASAWQTAWAADSAAEPIEEQHPDPFSLTHRAPILDDTWTALTSHRTWIERENSTRELPNGVILATSTDGRHVLVPTLDVVQRVVRTTEGLGFGWAARLVDNDYDAESVAAACRLADENDSRSLPDLAAALHAARL